MCPTQAQQRHILLEEFSTAPCGFCPEGDLIAEQLVRDHPSIIWVTHHAGFGVDSLTVPESKSIAGAFTTFAPGACIDRGDHPIPVYTMQPYIAVSRQKWDSVCTAHLADPIEADVSIINTFSPATRTFACAVTTTFLTNVSPGDIRINLYIVEDSVVGFGFGFDQTNYFNGTPGHKFYRQGDPIVGYAHTRVIRAIPSGSWGLGGIIPSAPQPGVPYEHTFYSISIPSRWKEEALDVVAFVSYYDTDAKRRQVIHSNSKRLLDGTTLAQGVIPSPCMYHLDVFPTLVNKSVALQCSVSNGNSGVILITDHLGRSHYTIPVQAGVTTESVSVRDFPTGIYFCRMTTSRGEAVTRSFIVIH